MFSSLSSYIWGGEGAEGAEATSDPAADSTPSVPAGRPRDPSPALDDWEVVGPSPAPGNLMGGLAPLPSPSNSSPASTPSSAVSEAGDEDDSSPLAARGLPAVAATTTPRAGVGHTSAQAVSLSEARNTRAAQICKQKSSGKALSSKALKRSNKAVMSGMGSGKKQAANMRCNLNIKMAGGNKNLKQC